jgi:hypothetical protein
LVLICIPISQINRERETSLKLTAALSLFYLTLPLNPYSKSLIQKKSHCPQKLKTKRENISSIIASVQRTRFGCFIGSVWVIMTMMMRRRIMSVMAAGKLIAKIN